MSSVRIEESCERSSIDAVLKQWGRSRLLFDEPYQTEPAHALMFADALDYAQRPDSRTAIVTDGGEPVGFCVWRASAWDAELFGFGVGRVEMCVARDGEAATALAAWIQERELETGVSFSSARASTLDLTVINALESSGYGYRETNLYPWTRLGYTIPFAGGDIREASSEDVPRIREIARTVFRTDRFHTDPRLSQQQADAVYVKWVDSWFAAPRDTRRSYVLMYDGSVAGMMLWDEYGVDRGLPHRVADLVLGAVDTTLGVRGLGTSLWAAGLSAAAQGCDYFTTTISLRNTAMLGLYAKFGFRFTASDVTLHKWYG